MEKWNVFSKEHVHLLAVTELSEISEKTMEYPIHVACTQIFWLACAKYPANKMITYY